MPPIAEQPPSSTPQSTSVQPVHRVGPLFLQSRYKDTKDPCPIFDGNIWHIFGSGGSVRTETWQILHATAPLIDGPWTEQESVILNGVTGDHVAAPGIIHDGTLFHMFVQKDFLATGAGFEYLTSQDGKVFTRVNTALEPIPQSEEAGLYDPHPSIIKGERYIAYSGTPRVVKTGNRFISQPNIYLAKSMTDSWAGPWERKGKILDHTDIAQHHNQTNHQDYEWGIEGPQLIELKDGKVLLNATCFLPYVRFGLRQKVFFALADTPEGPYTTLGPVLTKPMGEWDSGENGHAAGVMINGMLNLFYQARSGADVEDVPRNDWRYGIAHFNPNDWS